MSHSRAVSCRVQLSLTAAGFLQEQHERGKQVKTDEMTAAEKRFPCFWLIFLAQNFPEVEGK